MCDYEATFNFSYWRALETTLDGVSFVDTFYDLFLSQSSEISKLFANTDLPTQKRMLTMSLLHVAAFDPICGPDEIMTQLAIRHRQLGIPPDLYRLWLDSLLDAVKAHDPEWNEDVCKSWHRKLSPGIEFMISEEHE